MSQKEALAFTFLVFFALFAGVYLGRFVEQTNTLFSCERDQKIVIEGAMWKHPIPVVCGKPRFKEPT